MRSFAPAALACFALAAVVGGWLIATVAHGGSTPVAPVATPPAGAPAGTAAAAAAPGPAPIDNDAPARHARRTACLKEAKSKKLVGAKRTAYVKGCMGAS